MVIIMLYLRMAVSILFLAVLASGCGKGQESVSVEMASGNMEELQDETAEDAGNRSEEGRNLADADESAGKSVENGVAQEKEQVGDDGSKARDSAQDDNGQQTQENHPDAQDGQAVSGAQLEGNVYSVSEGSLVIVRAETWEEGDASYTAAAAPGYEAAEDLVTVHVAKDCVYQYKTVKNGGIHPEDVSLREGNFADLRDGIAVDLKGSWQDDGSFLADQIEMMEFV